MVDPTASLVAELGILALIAHVRWFDPANQQELAASSCVFGTSSPGSKTTPAKILEAQAAAPAAGL
jgi:hypothetical protein